ncbi:MAG TPA: zinc-binding alcohol dehydrogenase family protein, partial [Sphingobium sp.]|nr:zinc-binding alcohol dehydrogenase family protein [Sphingobium sp.]
MKAVGFRQGGPLEREDSLIDIEVADPSPGPRDLLVRVRAVSVNPVDTKVRGGAKPAEEPMVLGYDAAGVVEAVGADVTLFAPGDEVFYAGTIKRPGTNSELHVVDERIVGPKPRSFDFAQAAALPLTGVTAWELLFDRLRVSQGGGEGQTILIVNGAGGVGSMLVQFARQLTKLRVIATASRPETIAWVKQMGAHDVIDHRKPLNEGLAGIGVKTVNFVASLAASEQHLPAYARIIAPQGSLAVIDDVKSFDIVALRQKSITVAWEGVFTRSIYETPDMIEQHRI